MKVLGIDFGERRIGLAMSDPEGRFALPHGTLERQTDRRAVYAIAELARREDVALLVLGEPRAPDGAPHPASERIRRFGAKLARAARRPVTFVDETLTTVAAAERLGAAGLDADPRAAGRRGAGRRNDGRRDAVAAQILLQEALDRGLVRQSEERESAKEPEPMKERAACVS